MGVCSILTGGGGGKGGEGDCGGVNLVNTEENCGSVKVMD